MNRNHSWTMISSWSWLYLRFNQFWILEYNLRWSDTIFPRCCSNDVLCFLDTAFRQEPAWRLWNKPWHEETKENVTHNTGGVNLRCFHNVIWNIQYCSLSRIRKNPTNLTQLTSTKPNTCIMNYERMEITPIIGSREVLLWQCCSLTTRGGCRVAQEVTGPWAGSSNSSNNRQIGEGARNQLRKTHTHPAQRKPNANSSPAALSLRETETKGKKESMYS